MRKLKFGSVDDLLDLFNIEIDSRFKNIPDHRGIPYRLMPDCGELGCQPLEYVSRRFGLIIDGKSKVITLWERLD